MTQPLQKKPGEAQQSWVQDLINRYRGMDPREGYSPIGFDFQRASFDPNSFFREMEAFKNIGRAATNVEKQKSANRRIQEAQEAIDLSRITPKFTGASTQSGHAHGNTTYPGGKTPKFSSPLRNYSLTSGYGPRRAPTRGASSFHRGLDMAAPSGTPIYATHNGVVHFSGWTSGYGYNVSINGGGGIQTFYGHNSRNAVRPGQQVRQGQLIGYVGSTGVSTGPHLHYEVRINGQAVNPAGYL